MKIAKTAKIRIDGLPSRVDGDTLKGAFRHLIDRMPTADREALRSAIDDLQPQ